MSAAEQTSVNASTLSPVARAAHAAGALLRRDWTVIVLLALGTAVMTYPVAFKLNQGVIGSGPDAYQALWQDWWLRKALVEGHSLTYTTYLFYPRGADATFNAQHWATLPIWWPLSVAVGDVAAGNLTYLIGLVMSGYFAYLLGLYLTHNRAAAWLGGVVFAFFPYHFRHLGRAMSHMEWLPLFMLAFVHSLHTRKAVHILLAALALSLSTLTHPRLAILAVLSGAVYGLYYLLSTGQWRSGRMWAALALFVVLAIAFNLPPMLPYLRLSGEQMDQALEKGSTAIDERIDVIAYVCPPPYNRLLFPLLQRVVGRLRTPIHLEKCRYLYLGMIPLALVIAGLVLGRPRNWFPWALMVALFMMLALGPTLYINGKAFPDVWMPYRTLRSIPVFEVMRHPERFAMGLALPWAMLAGYGVVNALTRLRPAGRVRLTLMLVVTGLTLVEYWIGPMPTQPTQVSPYYYQLANEPGDFAIVELPMGRVPSKGYMFNQTIHGKPIVEGMMSRPIGDPYAYIEGNPVLAAWQEVGPLPCDPDKYEEAFDVLLDDGFRYVIVHWQDQEAEPLKPYFQAEPAYQDSELAAYRLEDLKAASLPASVSCR
jgi:hypothetical protein